MLPPITNRKFPNKSADETMPPRESDVSIVLRDVEVVKSCRSIFCRERSRRDTISVRQVFSPNPRILKTQAAVKPLAHFHCQRMIFATGSVGAIEDGIEIPIRTRISNR